jgi:hypothetical protein
MPRLTVLIFGVGAPGSGPFRLHDVLIAATTVGEVIGQLSSQLGVTFVPEPFPDLPGSEPAWFRIQGQNMPGGLAGVFVERDGARCCVKQDLNFALRESDKVVVSTVA